jgi:hypothetical protein
MKQRTPMKPILGWLITSSRGKPLYITLGRAPKSASGLWRTIRVEIRERPKPRLAAKERL